MLTSVSETALITLKAKVKEASYDNPILVDPKGEFCYNQLLGEINQETKDRILKKDLPRALTNYIALRTKKFDSYTEHFIKTYPDSLIVNLGCGFDTRFWRTHLNEKQYIELDLPNVIEVKKKILGDQIPYLMLSESVLENQWIEKIKSIQTHHILFLAEGLLMYLPENQVISLFKALAGNFSESEFAFEVVNKKYTIGFNKKMVELKMKHQLGNNAGSSYDFGITGAKEIESYHKNLKVLEEWSYLEEDQVKPSFLKFFKHFTMFTRTQWTMKISLK